MAVVRKSTPKAVMAKPETTPMMLSTLSVRFVENVRKEIPFPITTAITTKETVGRIGTLSV